MANRRVGLRHRRPGDEVAEAVHVLDNRYCVAIMALLTFGRRDVSELALRTHSLQPNVSRALATLLDLGWVTADRQGKHRVYELSGLVEVKCDAHHLVIHLQAADGDVLHMMRTYKPQWLEQAEAALRRTVRSTDDPEASVTSVQARPA